MSSYVYKGKHSSLPCCTDYCRGNQRELSWADFGGEEDEWEIENPFVVSLFASQNWRDCLNATCFLMTSVVVLPSLPEDLKYLTCLKASVLKSPGWESTDCWKFQCKIGCEYQWAPVHWS